MLLPVASDSYSSASASSVSNSPFELTLWSIVVRLLLQKPGRVRLVAADACRVLPSQHVNSHIASYDSRKASGMGCVAERVVHSPKPKHRVACRIVRIIGTRKIAAGIAKSYVAQLWRHLFKLYLVHGSRVFVSFILFLHA